MRSKQTPVPLFVVAATLAAYAVTGACQAADAGSPAVSPDAPFWTKPAWLSDLSFAVKESYDGNVFGVSGLGLPVQSSWVNAVSATVGLNFVPLLGDRKNLSTLSLSYNPERVTYASVSSQDYTAHRINGALKAKSGDVTFSLVDSFLYNDGNKLAPTYALNQLSGAAGNQNDKYRDSFAHALPRERLNQDQDRYSASVQFDEGSLFVRPISQLIYYDPDTYLFNTSVAPHKGYQDYVVRYDVNAGVDLGYYIVPGVAFTLGYRDGHQEQGQFALAINTDQHFSTNNYQRALVGLEGELAPWLTVKLAAGPDFREYNPNAPISDLRTTRYYGEGTATATLPDNQSLTLGYKQWLFVSSTGLVPYVDTSISAAYHWNATKRVGFDLGVKYLELDYRLGDDIAGSAPSLRDDIEEDGSAGVSYAVTRQFILSVADTYDKAYNGFGALPATLFPEYHNFTHNVVTFGAQFRF